jgi:hypothetical protein
MKKALFAAMIAFALLLSPTNAGAHEYDRDDTDQPARIVGYILHPIGIAIEYAILRPIHWFVSKPEMAGIFGHEPREDADYDYMKWEQQN